VSAIRHQHQNGKKRSEDWAMKRKQWLGDGQANAAVAVAAASAAAATTTKPGKAK